MRLPNKMALNLFEAAEADGIRREMLTAPLGLDASKLVDPQHGIEWDVLVRILDRLSTLLGDDVERLRSVGRQMAGIPSYAVMRRIARTVLTLQSLYEAGERWIAPANTPHLAMRSLFVGDDRMTFRCTIPEPHAPSAPYLHVFEGLLTAVPRMLGLPLAAILRSEVDPRHLEIELALPPSRALFSRMRRSARALFSRNETLDLLEQQRHEIVEGLGAAQRATEEIETLFRRLPDFVLVHRLGLILWTNRAMVAGLGYDAEDALVGRQLLDIIAPASRAFTERRMGGAEDHLAPDLAEVRLLRRDGSTLVVEVAPTQAVTFGGERARLIVGRDVTERQRLQQQVLTADRMASIGMLAAGVAHEVNNPLAYVLNNIEMVMKDLAPLGERTERSREALGVALQGVDHIRTIVRDLLALSRVDDASIGAVDVAAVVSSTLSLAARNIADRAELTTDFEAGVPMVRGTPARLGQVFLNLLANAVEAMPATSRSDNLLHVAVRSAPQDRVVVEVTDNGLGIAPENAGRVFDPFFTTKPFGHGTGLGLAISQHLVAEVDGELSFESTPGRGSTFRVTLARADSAPLSSEAQAASP